MGKNGGYGSTDLLTIDPNFMSGDIQASKEDSIIYSPEN